MGNRNLLPSKAAFLLGPPGFSGQPEKGASNQFTYSFSFSSSLNPFFIKERRRQQHRFSEVEWLLLFFYLALGQKNGKIGWFLQTMIEIYATACYNYYQFSYPPVAKLDIAADSDSEGRGSNPSGRARCVVKFHTACSFFALFMGGLNLKAIQARRDGILGNGRLCRAANIEISLGLAVVARGYFSGRLLIQRKKPLEKGNCRVQGMEDVALYCAKEKKQMRAVAPCATS